MIVIFVYILVCAYNWDFLWFMGIADFDQVMRTLTVFVFTWLSVLEYLVYKWRFWYWSSYRR